RPSACAGTWGPWRSKLALREKPTIPFEIALVPAASKPSGPVAEQARGVRRSALTAHPAPTRAQGRDAPHAAAQAPPDVSRRRSPARWLGRAARARRRGSEEMDWRSRSSLHDLRRSRRPASSLTPTPPRSCFTKRSGFTSLRAFGPHGGRLGTRRHTDDTSLGMLSEKYETGGRGPGTMSSGVGDAGGISYGSYEMTSKGGGTRSDVRRRPDLPVERRLRRARPG